MYSTLPTHFRAYNNVQLIIHFSRVWNSTKVQIYLTDAQTRFLRKPCVVWQNFVLHFQLITYILYNNFRGALWRGERVNQKNRKYRSDIHMYVGRGYNVFKLREKGLAPYLCIYIYAYRWWIKNATDWLTKRDGPLNGAEWDAGTFLASFSTRSLYMRLRNTVCALTRRI